MLVLAITGRLFTLSDLYRIGLTIGLHLLVLVITGRLFTLADLYRIGLTIGLHFLTCQLDTYPLVAVERNGRPLGLVLKQDQKERI